VRNEGGDACVNFVKIADPRQAIFSIDVQSRVPISGGWVACYGPFIFLKSKLRAQKFVANGNFNYLLTIGTYAQ